MANSFLHRSKVISKNNYSEYKQELRQDFLYSCAYCSSSEKEFHGSFEIDHYLPQASHPDLKNDYLNLIWSCHECNRYKSDYDSSISNYKIFRPDLYKAEEHFELFNDRIKSKTEEIGEATITILNLNSERLRTLRTIRCAEKQLGDKIEFGIHQLSRLLRANKINAPEIIKRIEALKLIKGNLNKAILQYAEETCSTYEYNEDPTKKEYLKQRKSFLKTINN